MNEKLEGEAETVRQGGWAWVEIMTNDFDLSGYGEVKGKAQPIPSKQIKAIAKLEREADRFPKQDELDDEQAERLEALEAEIEALSERVYIWSDRQKKRAGAILTVDHNGQLIVLRGLIRPEDAKAKPADGEAASGETEARSVPGLSSTLANDLTAHRTAALRALLADNVVVALAAAAHALALPLFYDSGDSAFALHVISPALRAEGIEDSPAREIHE